MKRGAEGESRVPGESLLRRHPAVEGSTYVNRVVWVGGYGEHKTGSTNVPAQVAKAMDVVVGDMVEWCVVDVKERLCVLKFHKLDRALLRFAEPARASTAKGIPREILENTMKTREVRRD